MKYFETKYEKDSARITALIVLILVLLIFIVGPKYTDPPLEYGVAVNFGNSDVGSGKIQPKEPVKSTPQEVSEPIEETKVEETEVEEKVEEAETEEVEPDSAPPKEEVKEEVLTTDNAEVIAIKKQREADAKLKLEADAKAAKEEAEKVAKAKAKAAKEKVEADRVAKEKKEKADKKKKLDALIGGIGKKTDGKDSGGEGDDDKAGDKGQLDGNPYAPSYFGEPGSGKGGSGYGLNGRGKPTKNITKQDCNEEGRVVVKITVNKSGQVIKAEPGVKGTTNNASCLLEPARKTALSHKWPADAKAPTQQVGFIVINFSVSQ